MFQKPHVPAGLTGHHDPVFEGLRHGGVAEQIRHAMTSFGSGWRGLVGVGDGWAEKILGPGFHGVAIANTKEFAKYLKKNPFLKDLPSSVRHDFEKAFQWSKDTGLAPVVMNLDHLREMPRRRVAELLRHERIHASHLPNQSHPFFEQELKKTGSLEAAITRSYRGQVKAGLLDPLSGTPEAARDLAQRYKLQLTWHPKGAELLEGERLAWTNQADTGFFKRLRRAGLTDPRQAQGVMAAGRSQAMAHAGSGLVSKFVRGARRMLRSL